MNRLHYFLGVIIPIPLFFDLYSLSFFIQLLTSSGDGGIPIDYAAGSYSTIFAPVPIGIITFALVALLSVFSIKEKIHAISVEVLTLAFFLMFFIVLSVLNIGVIKTLMLLFPFLCMYFVIVLTKNMRAYEKICSGYVVSFLFFVSLHVLSVLYLNINGVKGVFFLFNSIFGIQIYQASVSYSAVLSYSAVTLYIYSLYKSSFLQKMPIYFFVFIILFLLSLGARKAVLLDLVILFSIFFCFIFLRVVVLKRIKKINILLLFLFPFLLLAYISYTAFSGRDIGIAYALMQRGEHYTIFSNLMADADLSQVLFGHGGSWGGFSNIYIEMIYRLGVVGILLYFTAFFIGLVIVRKRIKYLFNFDKLDHYFSLWLWFTVLTIALSNIFNMNLQLPYYSMNLTMIMMIFLYRTKFINLKDGLGI
jgi:hypothetical protein